MKNIAYDGEVLNIYVKYGESLGKYFISLTHSCISTLKRSKNGNMRGNDDIKTKT